MKCGCEKIDIGAKGIDCEHNGSFIVEDFDGLCVGIVSDNEGSIHTICKGSKNKVKM